MKRALSIADLYRSKHRLLDFDGMWLESFGKPEFTARWFIMAPPGSGKTTFAAMLCKHLSQYEKVAYNSIEEGNSESLKEAFRRVKMHEVARRVIVLDKEPIAEMIERLSKPKAPRIAVIDTIQHAELTKSQYLNMLKQLPNTMFILISHMDGRQPEGNLARFIRQDAGVKITIEGYVAFTISRYGGGEPFVIWRKGAEQYYSFINQKEAI
jgi:thymidylate kinase